MNVAQLAVDMAIKEAKNLRRILRNGSSVQVQSNVETKLIASTALSWFNNHRSGMKLALGESDLAPVDADYKFMLAACEGAGTRKGYLTRLKAVTDCLVELKSERALDFAALSAQPATSDRPPAFATLILDGRMQEILLRRWAECIACVQTEAPLAATVMMGGLLEALLLARVNGESDKSKVFKAAGAPKDKKTGKALPLSEWTLQHYIGVAHELTWISRSAMDVSKVLRDYRNYIHPQKQLSHGVLLKRDDAELFWDVCKSLSRQVIASVPLSVPPSVP
jgi:hypothetical protein